MDVNELNEGADDVPVCLTKLDSGKNEKIKPFTTKSLENVLYHFTTPCRIHSIYSVRVAIFLQHYAGQFTLKCSEVSSQFSVPYIGLTAGIVSLYLRASDMIMGFILLHCSTPSMHLLGGD